MNPSLNFNLTGNQKTFRAISYTLIFLMMACFAMTVGVLIRNAIPAWSSDIIAGIALFIVIDRLYTYKRMKTLNPLSREWALTLGAQWVVIVLFTKALLSFAHGPDALNGDISAFTRGQLANLFSIEFIVALLLALLVWYVTGQFLVLLDEIGLDPQVARSKISIPGQKEAPSAHQRLVTLTIQVGIGLVIMTVVTRINLNEIFDQLDGSFTGLSRFSGAETGALFYFIFGFALFCLSRLISLQTHWSHQHIPVASDNLATQWGLYSVFFLLILIFVVGLLSSGNSLGLFSLLTILFEFLISTFFFVAQLLWFLLSLILSIPFLLFGANVPFPRVLPPPPTPTPLPPEALADAVSTPDPTLALIKSIFLWGALVVIVGFSIVRFVRQHGGLQATFRKLPIASWLFFLWQWLSKNADKTRRTLSSAIADAWQRIVSRTEGSRIFPRPGLIRLSALDPRQQIYFFYLAMIRRGSEQGVERKSSQTPSEYAATLERAIPSVNEDVRSMTEAFMAARYSPREINSGEANLVKAAWNRIRRALQMSRKSK